MVELTAGTFYGDAASFSIADALLSELHHPKPRTMPEHTHAVPHFCLLLGGEYEESAHGEKIVFAPQTNRRGRRGAARAARVPAAVRATTCR